MNEEINQILDTVMQRKFLIFKLFNYDLLFCIAILLLNIIYEAKFYLLFFKTYLD